MLWVLLMVIKFFLFLEKVIFENIMVGWGEFVGDVNLFMKLLFWFKIRILLFFGLVIVICLRLFVVMFKGENDLKLKFEVVILCSVVSDIFMNCRGVEILIFILFGLFMDNLLMFWFFIFCRKFLFVLNEVVNEFNLFIFLYNLFFGLLCVKEVRVVFIFEIFLLFFLL